MTIKTEKEKEREKERLKIFKKTFRLLKKNNFNAADVGVIMGCTSENIRRRIILMKQMGGFDFPDKEYECSCMATNEERLRYYDHVQAR